jgi:hypothetical protein
VSVHAKAGSFALASYEYVLVLGTAALAVGFSRSRYSVDGMVSGRNKQAVSGESGIWHDSVDINKRK